MNVIQRLRQATHRSKAVILGSFSIISARSLGIICQLVLTAILVRYFSHEQFGVWALVQTSIVMMNVFDFGLSSTLQNKIANARSEHRKDISYIFYHNFIFALLIITILTSALYFFKSLIPWDILIPLKMTSKLPSIWMMLIAAGLLRQIPLLAKGVLFAFEKTHLFSTAEAVQILISTFVAAIMAMKGFSFFFIVQVYILLQFIGPLLCLGIIVFKFKWYPKITSFYEVISESIQIIKPSILLWLLSACSMFLISAAPFIATHIVNVKEIGNFYLLHRLYNLILMVNWAITTPMWAAFTLSVKEDNYKWITKSMRKTLAIFALTAGIGGAMLALMHPWIIFLWTGNYIQDLQLAISLWVLTSLLSINSMLSTFLNAINKIATQFACNLFGCALFLILGMKFGKTAGLSGIIWAEVLIFILLIFANFKQVYDCITRKVHFLS